MGSKRDDRERYSEKVIEHTNPLHNSDGVIELSDEGPSGYR